MKCMPGFVQIRKLWSWALRIPPVIKRMGISVLALSLVGLVGETQNGFDLSQRSVPLEDILSGGPPRDGIPALIHPNFVSADDATFLQDNDRILGILGKGEAKAYPIKIMTWHEVVNDSLDERPIVVTYCPLCGSGIGFTRKVRGRAATFGVSGLLYQSDLLMYDHQSESLWSQMAMECVAGPLTGEKLDPVYLEHTTWGEWKKSNPQSLALSIHTGYSRAYDRDPYLGYAQNAALMFPTLPIDPRYHTKEWVLGVEIKGTFKAYPFSELSKIPGTLHDTVNGQPLVIQLNRTSHSAKAFTPNGSHVHSLMAYWFAWSAFHPDTLVYTVD